MKHMYKALYGALLVLGLAGVTPVPALANGGSHWDTVCNCMRPDSEYNTRRYVRAPTRVNTHTRVVNHTNVVKRTKLIQENRLIVHVRPVINREVVVHRQNTIVRNITLHKVNTTNKLREENRHETVNRYVRGSVRVVNEYRNVRGVNCNCGYDGGRRSYQSEEGDGQRVSYRD
jgi:hypothetical protein